MKRFTLALIALLAANPAFGGTKPLVTVGGRTQQIPAATTLVLNPPTTGAATINLPHGTAPTSPNNGDCWTTTSGLNCRINGTTLGPLIGANNTATPAFTGGSYVSPFAFLSGGINPSALYASQQAGYFATDGLTVGVTTSTATGQHQANGIAAYIDSKRARPTGNGGDVAIYTEAHADATNANVFGINALTTDTIGFTGQVLQNEFDFNVFAGSTGVSGLSLVLNSTVGPAANAFICRSANVSVWVSCFYIPDGSGLYAMSIGTTATGNNVFSLPINFNSRSSGGTTYTSSILSDPSGALLLRPGLAGGAISFQDFGGANSAYITSAGLNVAATTASTTTGTGAIVSAGGLGVAGAGNFGGAISTVSSSSTGIDGLTIENGSSASVTTKYVNIPLNGRDTVNTKKTIGGLRYDPVDVNWVNTKVTLNGRRGDAVSPMLTLGGAGSPESVVTASPGALYTRTDGGAGTTLYVKETGTGNTGWVAK